MIFTNIPCRHPRRVQPDHVWRPSHLQLWHFGFVQDKLTANTRQQLGICPLCFIAMVDFIDFPILDGSLDMLMPVTCSQWAKAFPHDCLAWSRYRYSLRSWYIILIQSTFLLPTKPTLQPRIVGAKMWHLPRRPNLHGPINIGHCLSSLVKVVDIAWFAECLSFSHRDWVIHDRISPQWHIQSASTNTHPKQHCQPPPWYSQAQRPHNHQLLCHNLAFQLSTVTRLGIWTEFCSEGIL